MEKRRAEVKATSNNSYLDCDFNVILRSRSANFLSVPDKVMSMATQLPRIPDVERISPLVIRILGGNPSIFTLQGQILVNVNLADAEISKERTPTLLVGVHPVSCLTLAKANPPGLTASPRFSRRSLPRYLMLSSRIGTPTTLAA